MSIQSQNRLILLTSREFQDWEIGTLIPWASDPDADVRSWVACVLSSRNDDDEIIRNALVGLMEDEDFEARSEAMLGLARRRDSRAMIRLIGELSTESVGTLNVEAAGYFAHSDLIVPLEELRSWWDVDPALLEESLERCRGNMSHIHRIWEYADGIAAPE